MAFLPSFSIVLLGGGVLIALGVVAGGVRLGRRLPPLAQVRGRLLAAAGTAVLLLLACALLNDALPQALGRPLAMAPALAAAGALLAFGLLPWRRDAVDGARTAPLARRSLRDAVRPAALVPVLLLAGALMAVLSVAVATADPDGRSFTVSGPGWSGTAGPYPGWFYAVPIASALLVAAVATVVALRRTALLPEVFEDPERDRRWRRGAGSVVLMLLATALLLELAGTLWALGGALRSTVASAELNRLPVDATLVALAPAVTVGWPLCVLGALVLLVVAAVRATAVGRVPVPA